MRWFVPLNRGEHPCIFPDTEERKLHRPGEMIRCEVCDELFVLRKETPEDPPYPLETRWVFYRLGLLARWRFRKEGYANGSPSDPGLPTD